MKKKNCFVMKKNCRFYKKIVEISFRSCKTVVVQLAILYFMLVSTSFSQDRSSNTSLVAYLQTKQFLDPQGQPYIELQFQYVGNTVVYKLIDSVNNNLQGEIAVVINVLRGAELVANDAYRLPSPIIKDEVIEDFYDIKRFSLSPGEYSCQIELFDLNAPNQFLKNVVDIVVEDRHTKSAAISDILIAETAYKTTEQTIFSRSGYDIFPRISTFYSYESLKIPYYFEVYWTKNNIDTNSEFSVVEQILVAETHEILTDYTKVSRHKIESHVPIFSVVDLAEIPSGNYLLRVAVINAKGEEIATRIYEFERNNDYQIDFVTEDLLIDPNFQLSIHQDSIAYYLASLIPIAQPQQVRIIVNALKEKDTEKNRKIIQSFWKQKDPQDSYQAWMRYKELVMYVERRFKTHFQPGFETDRGRVYLQYGAPNRVTEREVSPSEYPYEMWEYNKIKNYSNRKFIFYNPDLLHNTYRLLHSDMIGELRNPAWQYELNSRNNKRGNVDEPNEYNPDSWGNNARQLLGK